VTFRAVLDACVLYPFSLRDTLLRLAERELYDVYWSDRILEEVTRNLVANDLMTEARAQRLAGAMRMAFDAATVSPEAIDRLEPVMTNDPKDRHVLAAAVVADAEAVVTSNLKDFPDEACEPWGVEAMHPDEFLLILQAKRPGVVLEVLTEQAGDLTNPPWTLDELLDALAKVVPEFVAAVRRSMA
jgi:predicted nucleic acid-binding protein